MTSTILNKILKTTLIIIFWLLVWQVVYLIVGQEIIIPSPLMVLKIIANLFKTTEFYLIVLMSVLRVLAGFVLGFIIGILFSYLTFNYLLLKSALSPVIETIKSTPVVSFILIVMIFVKPNYVAVVLSALIVFPLVYQNVLEGIKQTDNDLLQMAEIFRFSKFKKVKLIYFESIKPYLTAAFISGIGFSFKAGISGEVLSIPKYSIGLQMYNSKIYLETDRLIAWSIIVIVLSFVITKLAKVVLKNSLSKDS